MLNTPDRIAADPAVQAAQAKFDRMVEYHGPSSRHTDRAYAELRAARQAADVAGDL